MDRKAKLIESIKSWPGKAGVDLAEVQRYDLVQVKTACNNSAGDVLRAGDLALACPDTYEVSGRPHKAVYSLIVHAHVLVPTTDFFPVPPVPHAPKPPPQTKGGP